MLNEVRHIFLALPQSNPQLIKWEMVIWFSYISHLFQHSPFYTNLTFTCKTETLGSLYSHAVDSLKS